MTGLQENERLRHAATMAIRAPDGSIAENVKLYEIVKIVPDQERENGLTTPEARACNAMVRDMAAKFGEYIAQTTHCAKEATP